METIALYNIIKNSLPESHWGCVIRALKHDLTIWESIQQSQLIDKIKAVKRKQLEDWSPANLGLMLINFKVNAKELQNSHLPVLDGSSFNKAFDLLERMRLDPCVHDLEEAIFLALAIREKHCLGDSWFSIRKDILGIKLDGWLSVLTCVYGLIGNQINYLEECISYINPSSNSLQLLNIILSNPIDEDQQFLIMKRLLSGGRNDYPPVTIDSLKFLHHLSQQRPNLAKLLGKHLIEQNKVISSKKGSSQSYTITSNLDDLETQLLNAELQNLVDEQELTLRHVNNAFYSLVNLLVELVICKQNPDPDQFKQEKYELEDDPQANKEPYEVIFNQESIVNHPIYRTHNLSKLIKNKHFPEAERWIRENCQEFETGFINNFVMTRNAHDNGNLKQATVHARNAVKEISDDDEEIQSILDTFPIFIVHSFLELLMDLGLYNETVMVAQKVVRINKIDGELYNLLGKALLADLRPEEAAVAFYNAVMLNPEDIALRRQLADSLETIGKWDDAYEERKNILDVLSNSESEPDISDLHKLTECAINLDYLEEAIQLSSQAILLDPEDGYSYSLIGKAYNRKEEVKAAFEQFEKGIQLSPHIPETWLALADAQHRAGNIEGAIEILQAASQAIPTAGEIYLALGEMQLAQNAFTEALYTFNHGIEINPNNVKLDFKLGSTLQLLGHLDEAKQVLENAHQQNPNHIEIAYAYAKVLILLGDKKNAIPLFDIVVRSNPTNPEVFLEYSEAVLSSMAVSVDKSLIDSVLNLLQKALELDPGNPITHALLGETFTLKEEYIAAKQSYQIALESDLVEKEEWFARLSLGMGRVALALGQEDIALASLQEALQADPNNVQIHKALSEVYRTVNLPENSLQSARAALNLAINDIDTLAWYADQMLLLSEADSNFGSSSPSNELLKQVQSEALNALHQAVQLAPDRANLLVKLGRMQLILGDKASGISTLNRLIDNEYAQVDDLADAGKSLADTGEICSAIACLEQAYNKDHDNSSQRTAFLLIDLAKLHQLDGDHESAIRVLNRATELNSAFAPIYQAKANLLLELKREDDALSCILDGLEKTVDENNQIHLFLLAGNIYRRRGELKTALDLAQEGLSHCTNVAVKEDHVYIALIGLITLIADLFQAILRPNRGRLLLKDIERKYRIDITEVLDYCCTYIELFFDSIGVEEITALISQMIERSPNHPRILALQARIFNRRGLYQTALQMLHAALEASNQKPWDSSSEKNELLTTPISVWYSLCDSALELYQWDTALYIAYQVLEKAPIEPRAHVNLARTIVMRAEYQWLCEKSGAVTNSPGISASTIESRTIFDQAILKAVQYLPSMDTHSNEEDISSEISKINPIINRWSARGKAIFGNEEEIKQAVNDLLKIKDQKDGNKLLLNTDDIAALIGADIRITTLENGDKLDKLIQMSRAYKQDYMLPLHTAIALSDSRPEDAKNLLDELTEVSQTDECPLVAIKKAVTAKVLNNLSQFEEAKSAIDDALEILPNEPHWHELAADIYLKLGNIPEAIFHTDEAIRIAPHVLVNHLRLGKILIENADIDPTNQKRAIQVLERACRLEPENADPWYYLSRAYLSIMDIPQAVSCSDMALSLAPENNDILSLRGEVALHQNKPQIALDYANQALQYHKHNTQAILIKSQALRDLGQVEKALEVLETTMEDMEDPLTLQIEYAILLKDVRGPKASIEALEQLVDSSPDNPKILSLLAKNMAELGEAEAAIQTAQKALRETNGNLQVSGKAELHYLLGSLFVHTGQLDQAVYHLSEAISLTPNYIEPYLELGHAQQERRQFRQALDAYQRAARIAPNDPRPHYQAGIAFKEGKDYQASESMLRRAADLAPEDVNIRRQLAAVVALNLVHNPRSKRILEE